MIVKVCIVDVISDTEVLAEVDFKDFNKEMTIHRERCLSTLHFVQPSWRYNTNITQLGTLKKHLVTLDLIPADKPTHFYAMTTSTPIVLNPDTNRELSPDDPRPRIDPYPFVPRIRPLSERYPPKPSEVSLKEFCGISKSD